MAGMVKRMFKKPSDIRKLIAFGVGGLIAGYGVYAFIKRDIRSYMFLKIQFVFFDFN